MNSYRQHPLASRGRHGFRWDRRFCVRQRQKYNVEDNKVLENPASTAALIEAFFDEHQSILNPPCYNYVRLKEFLQEADLQHLSTSGRVMALLDDRREDSGGDGSMRNWESDRYARQPPEGSNVARLAVDESALFTKLRENVSLAHIPGSIVLQPLTPRKRTTQDPTGAKPTNNAERRLL
jgi:hypothetical protein